MEVTPKEILFKNQSQQKLADGVNTLADAVRVTMGPGGENVIIESPTGPPILTKDGVTVAKAIALSLPFENMGVQAVKEAASKTAETAGDGTTTATVVTQAIVNRGQKLVAAGHNPVKIREGVSKASQSVIEYIRKNSQPVESNDEIIDIGTISANGDEQIGKFLAAAMDHVGRDGVITVDEARGFDTSLEIVDGFELDRGFISPYFITNQSKSVVEFDNPKILLANKRITTVQDLVPILESARRQSDSLLLIADDVDGDALKVCVLNNLKSIVKICVIRAPGFGAMRAEAMNDLGLLFNTKVYTQGESLPSDISELGTCEKFTGYRNSSIFVGTGSENPEQVEERLNAVIEMCNHPGLTPQEELYLRRRQAVLSGGIAVIRVGGSTDLELRERKDRIDDAVCATRAAARGGVVDGGGFSLLRASQHLKETDSGISDNDVLAGWNLLLDAITVPVQQIAINAGYVPEIILAKSVESELGFDARKGKWVNLKEVGVIDPLLVVESAISHATSAALNLLSVGCAIVEEKK
jgi:chaperonin GroEL